MDGNDPSYELLDSKENYLGEPCAVKRPKLPNITYSTNVTYQQHQVSRQERGETGKWPGFRGCTIWFTGLSAAGKSSVSLALEKTLGKLGISSYCLDGDNMRHGLCKNLSFSVEDRHENIRRVAEVAKILADNGTICLASFISPYREDRRNARKIHEDVQLPFIECYVNTSLEICQQRDPKKLYQGAKSGKIPDFTGVSSNAPYEPPVSGEAEIVLAAGEKSVSECVQEVLEYLYERKLLPDNLFLENINEPRELFVAEDAKQRLLERAAELPKVELSLIDVQWLQVLAEGWASPLKGFMRESQYLQCLHFNQLIEEGGINQSIPIVLAVTENDKSAYVASGKDALALIYNDKIVAVLNEPEFFDHRKEERCARTFGTTDQRHPTVKVIFESGNLLVGGDLEVVERIQYGDGLDSFRLTPSELRQRFQSLGADTVFAFQLRNPIHNGHAKLILDCKKHLLERGYKRPVLLLHPLGGWTKDDDVPLPVRIRQHEALLEEGVLDPNDTVLAIFPSPMSYAGPTEVQWHARARIAAGTQYYIVGRDPAGIPHPDGSGDLYNPQHGAKVLSVAPGLAPLKVLPFRVAAYNKVTSSMEYFDPTKADQFEFISGTKMRKWARSGQEPLPGFMAPKAWQVLADYYQSLADGDKSN